MLAGDRGVEAGNLLLEQRDALLQFLDRQERKLLPVHVTSAVELDDEVVRSLGERISEKTGRKVDLTARVEPDIIGGIVLRVGNSILDASIRNRLEQLRRQVARG